VSGIINGHAPNIFVPQVLTDVEREAMERLPLRDAMREINGMRVIVDDAFGSPQPSRDSL
jgi:hypothetical protein